MTEHHKPNIAVIFANGIEQTRYTISGGGTKTHRMNNLRSIYKRVENLAKYNFEKKYWVELIYNY